MSAPTPFFSDVYKKFTDLYYKSVVNEEEEPRVPEKVIRCVWNDQLFITTELKTTQGQSLEVVFPGYWNFGSGPDFKSASIKVDGKLHEGDVELHVYGSDWQQHGHSDDNEYDNVILHVFLWRGRGGSHQPEPGKAPDSLSRPHIPELEIKPFLKDGILKLNEELDFDSYPKLNPFNYGLCHEPLARLSEERFERLLDAAGDARTQVKMERMNERIITEGYEQTLYEGIAEALGYPSNKQAFRKLAENVPVAKLRALAENAPEDSQPVHVMEAVLFGVSGLLEKRIPKPSELKGEARDYVASLNKLWEKHRTEFKDLILGSTDWKFGKMRPANFPFRRISALAHLVLEHPDGLFQNYLNSLNSTISISGTKGYTTATKKKLFHHFCVEARGFWAWHYTAGGKKLQSSQQLIGSDRSREIFINIAIPVGLMYARASKSVPLETLLGKMYETPVRTADNQWIRFMKHYILGDKPEMLGKLNSDRRTQGLMQVYQDYCTRNQNNCLRCRFPGVVDKYFS